MDRFRSATQKAFSAPLSEAARPIVDLEKNVEEVRAESHAKSPVEIVVTQEEEVFEWKEIVRGELNPLASRTS